MINIFSTVEDIECTEHYNYSDELKEAIKDVVEEFLSTINSESYSILSDYHIDFNEEEDEMVLDAILSEHYSDFVESVTMDSENEYAS